MQDYLQTARYIGRNEGFLPQAKWDVNAWRLGFGSSTEGPDQVRVKPKMTTTRDRALQNLALRIVTFEEIIISQVTNDIWQALPQCAKMALMDFAYNYGSLTDTLAKIVQENLGMENIAQAVEDRKVD